MKTPKIIIAITIFLLTCLLIYSCTKDDNNPSREKLIKEITFNHKEVKIQYASRLINDHLIFNITINDKISGKILDEAFDVNIDKTKLPIEISHQITLKQLKLSSVFTVSEIERLVFLMDDMVNTVTRDMKNDEIRDLKTQGLFMCNSLIKSINRKVKKNTFEIQQKSPQIFSNDSNSIIFTSNSVYEGFNRELSSFALSEDLEINILNLKNLIDSEPLAQQKGYLFVKDVLVNYAFSSITMIELENKINEYMINNPDKFEGDALRRWPRGSDWGCCGNYSGACIVWSPVCLAHDAMCSDCQPRWFCLSGCRPD